MKHAGEKIACLTAYDYSFAALLERAGLDLVMVGDSLGMTMQGHDSTLPVSVAEMIYHTACVARGVKRALLVGDMPFMSYQKNPEQALANAGRLMRRGGAQVVKLEGGAPMAGTVRFLVERGVPVCGHLGLTPQSVHQLGGYRVQGREAADAERIRSDARALEAAGASLLVLEAVPAALAKTITQELSIPTIGIGAGPDCDGQILVLQDMLGIYPRPSPKFSKNFMEGAASIEDAVKNYVAAVKGRAFPGPEHSYT
ncbi:MAG: 3-methyl-2-oxobutanoate hydroxymethyltransferase [Candidatus Muproteobacteria bacterium RBG_16_65_34]|uniref:3-methyl-2-oxobutanoate hydroxymethyltransferase n=1 Tax=Candidatus Muproteobacteria bacterium RBG_16_65_34 TaxID=1817760 RepID=A0A1F6TND2_9PROT|nr:MAG: 3-methyl-2-oxobutanoate hydroxymethyltransferase [Candidatus Muproteobacteria bacterium RBG_16_65_34]